jgi:Holliday junction resolvase RusA-like endonuclease
VIKITLKGIVPSKKNSRINTRSGLSFPSAKYTAWHKDAINQLIGVAPIPKGTPLIFTYYSDSKRSGDLSNKWQSIEDTFTDCGIIIDDNWFELPDIHMKFGGIDRINPRAEIEYETK